jgi:DNA-binding IclR family transcriptional regulator
VTDLTNSSVDQVFDVLAVLSASEEPTGVAQLARTLDVPTSTAHRVLITLLEAGYVARDTTGSKYELGQAAHELTHALLRRFPIEHAAWPFLRRLAAETGNTALLTCRIGWHGVRLAGVEGWREIHAAPQLGRTSRLEDAPGGLTLLAFVDDEVREGYLRWRNAGGRPTAATRALRSRVAAIRSEGHLLDVHADDRADIAFPVRDSDGRAVAAIAIEAMEPEAGSRERKTRAARVRALAAELELILAEQPELAADPFAHLAPDELAPGFDAAQLT